MGARTNRRWEGGLAPVPRHHCAEGNRKTAQDDIRQAFNVFDKEQSGRISIDELTHVITTLGPDKLSAEQVAALVRDAGLPPAGRINYQEFVSLLRYGERNYQDCSFVDEFLDRFVSQD